jgi:soluble lytic murein transglycosylase-like protein
MSSAAAEGVGAASAAANRVAELQQMLAQLEAGTGAAATSGSGGFSEQLSAATAAAGQGASASSSVVTGASPTGTAPTTASATGTPVNPAVPFAAQINAAAARNGIDPSLLAGLIKAESNFQPDVGSGAGAQGLTELMPETAASVGVKDPHDPTESIEGGARVLREALDKFGGNVELALAAYNAGAGAVEQYNGIPPYPETQAYVPRVLGFAAEFRQGATR